MPRIRNPFRSHPKIVFATLAVLICGGGVGCLLALAKKPEGRPQPVPEAEEVSLPEAERAYLWAVEHQGNLLVKHGFGPLADALKRADTAALSKALAEDFTGSATGNPKRVQGAKGYAEVERLMESGSPRVPLSREGFVAHLMSFRKIFAEKPPEVKLALMTLSPKVRKQLDGGWEGTAQLRMYGEHARGAPAEVVVTLGFECPKPTKENLALPGWLRSAAVKQTLTAKAPHYLFAEVARARGLEVDALNDYWLPVSPQSKSPQAPVYTTQPGGAYVCDFDRDGILDLLITDVKVNALYKGKPDGTFENVTERVGLPRQTKVSVAAWADLDGDGWEDLILSGRIFRNEAGKRFEEYTDRCNLRVPDGMSAILPADYDCDGKIDLYLTRPAPPAKNSWLEHRSDESGGNRLFRNKGNWQFENVTKASGTDGGRRSTFTAAWLDANNDGWPDLHVINEFGDGLLLINNKNGTFSGQPLADRPADFGTMGVAVGDVDNDGNVDIYCANMYSKAGTRVIGNLAPDAFAPDVVERMRRFVAGSQLHLNRGGLKFDQVGPQMQVAAVGWAYGACLADLDNDGWLDIYATAGFVSRSRDEPDG